jgi:ribose/xylose/arabinose/galactoside ABC-type transport system permease subunit
MSCVTVSSAVAQRMVGSFAASGARIAMLFCALYFIGSVVFVPGFANLVNLGNILVQCTVLIILACGMTFVVMNGSIDFSVTAVLALSSIVGAEVMTMDGDPMVLTILGAASMLAVGMGIGALNGLVITRLRMPSFIATIATQFIFAGLALWWTQSATIGGLPTPFLMIGTGTVFGVAAPILICAIIVAGAAFVLHRTVLGRYVFAVGTNHRTSRISGIPVNRTICWLFVISGALAAVSAIIMTARSDAGMPALGKNMLMDVIAAVVVGGTSVTGGVGSILGTAAGAVLIVTLNNSLNLLGVEWYVINGLKGAMIIAVALLGALKRA